MFAIVDQPLETFEREDAATDPRVGGVVVFEGRVRNHNEGREVHRLEYEAYQRLAESEGSRILEEARSRFGIVDAICRHRVGCLEIGDLAVKVSVHSAHRDAAFDACRYIIDELKMRLPIWKKEHYTDGRTEWVYCGCQHGHDHP